MADIPIVVRAVNSGGEFKLSVINAGDKIPAAAMDRLFIFPRRRKAGKTGVGTWFVYCL